MNILKQFSKSSLIFKSGIASIDQAVLSFLNFFISILLIKTITKVEYGYYNYAFAISLFLLSIQNAIVNAPLAVLFASKRGAQKQNYCAALFYGQFIGILPAVCIALAGLFVMQFWQLDAAQTAVAAAVSFAAIGLFFREFLRAYYFADENPLRVLKLDIFYAVVFLILLAICYLIFKINVAVVFISMGISSIFIGFFYLRSTGWRYRLQSIKESYKENWNFGRWILFGVIVTHVQSYSYLYLMGALIGSEAVAEVSASRLLLRPLVLAMIGWKKIAVPHGSRLREQQRLDLFLKQQLIASLIFVFIIAVYAILLLSFSSVLMRLFLTENYANSFNYILAWSVILAIQFICLHAVNGLLVTKNFHIIAKVNFVTMLISIGFAFFLIRSHGIEGGLIALIIGDSLLALGLWFFYVRALYAKAQKPLLTTIKKEASFKLHRKKSGTA
jgi:O-antigen/teichoic acid export membrane protein